MFNIGFAELLLILLIAFVVVGPKDLPKVAKSLGRFVRYVRRTVEEVKRETGLDEVEKDIKAVSREVGDTVRSADIRTDLQRTQQDLAQEIGSVRKDLSIEDTNTNQGGQ